MKKNLKIVSAAAAALLAVAPVVATVANVNADVITDFGDLGNLTSSDTINLSTSGLVLNVANGNVGTKNSFGGNITATVNGKSVTAILDPSTKVSIWAGTSAGKTAAQGATAASATGDHSIDGASLQKGDTYWLNVGTLTIPVGSKNANTNVNVSLKNILDGQDGSFQWDAAPQLGSVQAIAAPTTGENEAQHEVRVSSTGDIVLKNVVVPVVAHDLTDNAAVFFASKENSSTRTPVTAGTITLTANSNTQLSLAAVLQAAKNKYDAYQADDTTNSYKSVGYNDSATRKSLTDALKALKITPDSNGFFTAPKSFTFNLVSGNAAVNNASASLPITVTVPNGKDLTPAQETGVSKTIMHVASVYDKNGKKTSDPEIHAYATVSVVATPVELKDASGKSLGKFYKVANKDQYIKVGNIDGTKRTLKHNSYLYRRTASGKFVALTHKVGKKHRKVVVKSGTEETTYGSRLYGKRYYRIDHNRYMKAANF